MMGAQSVARSFESTTIQPSTEVLIGIGLWHALLGFVLVVGVFWLMEWRISGALIAGLVSIIMVVMVKAWLGPVLFDLTVQQRTTMLQIAIGCSFGGATLASIVFVPNLEKYSTQNDQGESEHSLTDIER